MSNIESKISQLEREIKKIDTSLETNYEEVTSKPDFFDKYQSMKSDLEAYLQKWEDIQVEIEQFIA